MPSVTDLTDPHRCKGGTPRGQCLNLALDGSDFCQYHRGIDQAPARKMQKYLLGNAEEQGLLNRYADDDALKSLREEIALVRVMVQNTLKWAQTDIEKINAYSKVNTFLLTLERLLKTCHTLDQSMGNLIAKPALHRLGQDIGQAIINRLEGVSNYESLVEALLGDLVRLVEDIDNGNMAEIPSEGR